MNIDDLKILIASKLDVTDFLDLIGYDLMDLVEHMEEQIEENWEVLCKAVE